MSLGKSGIKDSFFSSSFPLFSFIESVDLMNHKKNVFLKGITEDKK